MYIFSGMLTKMLILGDEKNDGCYAIFTGLVGKKSIHGYDGED